ISRPSLLFVTESEPIQLDRHDAARLAMRLALAELEASARLGATVFLALDDARVAGQETLTLDRDAQCRLVAGQCGRDAVTDSARLAGQAAALHRRFDIILSLAI